LPWHSSARVHRFTRAISACVLLADGCLNSLMPTAQFDQFENLDKPVMKADRREDAERLWHRLSTERDHFLDGMDAELTRTVGGRPMKYPITRFKNMEVALKQLEPFVKNASHLESGKPFENFGGMRSREILANWLLCATINAVDKRQLTFSSDPIGGDGIVQDDATGLTWPTEHVMVPRQSGGENAEAQALILAAIEQKRTKGGAAYASGKTLVVFLNAATDAWYPNRLARALPNPLHFEILDRRPAEGRGRGIHLRRDPSRCEQRQRTNLPRSHQPRLRHLGGDGPPIGANRTFERSQPDFRVDLAMRRLRCSEPWLKGGADVTSR
jgi:hypothetical protein